MLASRCLFSICMHVKIAAVLSEARQACFFLSTLVVWFMFTDRICVVTPSFGGWCDGVTLVQYCVHPEVEIILFGIIAVKLLISH